MAMLNHYTVSFTIASGASVSDAWAVDAGGALPAGIYMPAGWDAAAIGFQVSVDGVSFQPLYDQYGNPYTITTAAARAILLNPPDFAGFAWWKLTSVTAGTVTAVNQTATRILILASRPPGNC